MNHRTKGAFAACLYACAIAMALPCVAADRVELSDGSVLFGTVVDADSGIVTLETAAVGTLSIDYANVVSMQVESEVTLQMEDGSVLKSPSLAVSEGRLNLPTQAATSYALADLTRINPAPWELGDGYNRTGLFSGSLASQRGNTDTDELAYRAESAWESLKDRYRTELFGEVNRANGIENADNWTLRTRYDRTQTGNWYWGGGVGFEQDSFADLDLRASAGPYAGRKFFTEPVFELEAETGLAYISEDFITADDREYIGATWDLKIASNWLGGDSKLYYQQKGILNLEQIDNLVFNNTLGLSFPLFKNIEGSAEVIWDLNTGAVAGTQKLDETYQFRIGYTW
jgi:hypothetical protein